MTPEQAIDIIARSAIGVVATDLATKWEDYPEIGEDDWQRVLDRVEELLPDQATEDEYVAAYTLLEGRADHGEAIPVAPSTSAPEGAANPNASLSSPTQGGERTEVK